MQVTKDLKIIIAVLGFCAGAIWWAATIQSDLSYVKRDVAQIKEILTRNGTVAVLTTSH